MRMLPPRPMYVRTPHPSHRRRRHVGRSDEFRGRHTEEREPAWSDQYSPFRSDSSSTFSDSAPPLWPKTSSPGPRKEHRKESRKQESRDTTMLYSAVDSPHHCAHCSKLIYEKRGQNQIREKCTTCTGINYCSDCFLDGKHLPGHASHTFINVHSYPRNTKLPEDYTDIEVQRVLFPIRKSVLLKYSCFQEGKGDQYTATIKTLSSKPLWVWNAIWTWLQQGSITPTNLEDPSLDKAPKIELPQEYLKSKQAGLLGKGQPVLRNAVALYSVTKQLKLNALKSAQVEILRNDGKTGEDPIVILSKIYEEGNEQLRQWARVFMAVPGNAKKILEVNCWKDDLLALFKKDGRAALDFVEALVEAREKESKQAWWSRAPIGAATWTDGEARGSTASEWIYQDDHWWRRTPRQSVRDL
ncbi:MAG: hypothetical protein M1812_004072 [Candelaria pacifica]|nr:MAG: hypothetical protein M1812_004072 [Candelaria pacifica]